MTNLYYTPASGSVTSSLIITPENIYLPQTALEDFILPSSSLLYNDVVLTITASAYDTSGSAFDATVGALRVYINSGSNTLISFPIDNVNIYYNQSLLYVTPPTASIPTPPSASFLTYISFQTNSTSSSFNIYNNTKSTSSLIYTGSSNLLSAILLSNDSYTFSLSGSSTFYTSSITIIDNQLNLTASYVTASNSYSSASFSSSGITSYTISAQVVDQPYLKLTYGTGIYPVFNSSSLTDWNKHFNITASQLINSGSNDIYLIGGNINYIDTFSITGSQITNIYSFGLNSLVSESVTNASLISFPNISTLSNIHYLDYSNNNMTGSIPNLDNNPLLRYLDIKGNSLSGVIPIISSSQYLDYFDYSDNIISGSIPDLSNNTNLTHFDCSYNYLTGSIPAFPTLYNLTYFNCSNNLLSGIINDISGAISLTYFNSSGNPYLSGSIPILNNNASLTYFNCYNNNLSGSIPSIDNVINLSYFDVGSNNLTGSIPILNKNVNLTEFWCDNNYLSGSIPSLNTLSNLQNFVCQYNYYITGSIPYLGNNVNLVNFYCDSNSLTGYISGSISNTIQTFQANDNLLSQAAVDAILIDINNCNALSPSTLNLAGFGNSTPSAAGLAVTSSLITQGWTIYIN
jgi:Leucine-rich repeat (LRR) protein